MVFDEEFAISSVTTYNPVVVGLVLFHALQWPVASCVQGNT